jgi:hypothetical protein
MRIVHVWDQCNYAYNVTTKLKVSGVHFSQLRRLPEFGIANRYFGNRSRVASYSYQKWLLASVAKLRRSNCIFEVHTPHFYSVFPELAHRTIFHAHGSEIRETVVGGQHIETVNELTKFALQESPATFYSTPELGPFVRKYSNNSFWAPHVVDVGLNETGIYKKKNDFIIPSSWDTWKGSQEVITVIRDLLNVNPGLRFVGMDFGSQKEIAAALGVKLLTTRSRKNFHDLIRSSNIVIGHGYGILGATDLESIYLDSAYFPFLPSNDWMEAYGFEASDFPKVEALIDQLRFEKHHLNNSLSSFLSKVKRIHDHSSVENRLKSAYLQALA